MARNILFDFDPIKDGSWNMAPFHGDYVVKPRKSSPIDPYELMPSYPDPGSDPEAAPPKPRTRALAGLDGVRGRANWTLPVCPRRWSQHGLNRRGWSGDHQTL